VGNYKPYGHLAINIGGHTRVFNKEQTILFLYYNLLSGTAPKSLLDSASGSSYTVTTGKTFKSVGIINIDTTGAGNHTITFHQGDTEHAQTSLKFSYHTANDVKINELPIQIEIASAKYITIECNGGTSEFVMIVGYEE